MLRLLPPWTTTTTTTILFGICATARIVSAVTVVPAAIGIEPSQYWEGNDGPWSSFPIRVGTPAQDIRVFISTAATSTWIVGDLGCEGSGVPANCSSTRGSLFSYNASTSWTENGVFNLFVEDDLGDGADQGDFGFDTVELGFTGSGGPTLNHTVVAWITTFDFYIGQLGLNPRPTNFSSFNDPQTSYLSLLYEESKIPSLSWSYTAGAKYRFNGVLGSLTLGGYDSSLFEPNTVTFPFYYDQTRDLTVAIKAITASNATTSSLLPSGILSLIDSTVPQIWLPVEACKAFELAFGLTYDNTTNLYLVTDSQHTSLQAQNSNVTFTLAPDLSSTESVNITLPYASFDLQVSYPLVENSTRYFPLRRAANDTQYTLGRTFLQEAYLTINYHTSNFSVSQRTWTANLASHLVPIIPPNSTNTTSSDNGKSSKKSSSISGGAIAGIAVGAGVIIAITLLAIWFVRRRKSRKRKTAELEALEAAKALEEEQKNSLKHDAGQGSPNELPATKPQPPELFGAESVWRTEVDGTPGSERRFEFDGGPGSECRYELGGPEGAEGRVELEAPHGVGEIEGTLTPSKRESLSSVTAVVFPAEISKAEGATETEARGIPRNNAARPFSWQ